MVKFEVEYTKDYLRIYDVVRKKTFSIDRKKEEIIIDVDKYDLATEKIRVNVGSADIFSVQFGEISINTIVGTDIKNTLSLLDTAFFFEA